TAEVGAGAELPEDVAARSVDCTELTGVGASENKVAGSAEHRNRILPAFRFDSEDFFSRHGVPGLELIASAGRSDDRFAAVHQHVVFTRHILCFGTAESGAGVFRLEIHEARLRTEAVVVLVVAGDVGAD